MLKNIYAGDTIELGIIIKNTLGNPINITGSTIVFTMKSDLNKLDADAEVQVIVTTHSNPVQGETEIVVQPAATNNLFPGTYYYDIQFKDATGKIKTILYGTTKVLQTVTKTI